MINHNNCRYIIIKIKEKLFVINQYENYFNISTYSSNY